ncbi:MAG: hypothetical protein LBT83_08785 [Tannerella sp.]|jgi:hypothetical protein|nr:hypothetical protein [Tannerella sp.]
MNQQTKSIVFAVSGILVLAGSVLYLSRWTCAPYLFAVGAAGMTVCYMTASSKASNLRLRRLNRLNVLAGIAMIIASVFMYKQRMEWVACLLIASLVQIYTSFVNSGEQ